MTTAPVTVADLDGTIDEADWVSPGHVLTADEVAYIRSLRLPIPTPPNDDEESRFWVDDARDSLAYADVPDAMPCGADTVGVVDDEEGGVIAYVHTLNAPRIVAALALQAQQSEDLLASFHLANIAAAIRGASRADWERALTQVFSPMQSIDD